MEEKIKKILDELIPSRNDIDYETKLAIVGSDSLKAVAFLSTIEEDWKIEISDEFINGNLFSDIAYLISVIKNDSKDD